MTEADAIDRVETPVTVGSLVDDLRSLGLDTGDTVLVHASLQALGWVCGGPPAVIDAL
jgi:aminoglycoside 3-N-acetyltransferase